AITEALKALQVKKVAIATPYADDVNQLAHQYFTNSGLDITNMTGLGITNDYTISNLDIQSIYQMAIDVNTADADAVFISCTGLSAAHLIEVLENDLNKPVITSNQATFWHALRLSQIGSNLEGFGQLFNR